MSGYGYSGAAPPTQTLNGEKVYGTNTETTYTTTHVQVVNNAGGGKTKRINTEVTSIHDPIDESPQDIPHPVFSGTRTSVKLIDQTVLHLAILGALQKHGLGKTAIVLREESNIPQDAKVPDDAEGGILAPMLANGIMHEDAVNTLKKSAAAGGKLLTHHHNIADCARKTQDHHKKVNALTGRIKEMKEDNDWLVDESGGDFDRDSALRDQIQQQKGKVAESQRTLQERMRTEVDLQRRLKEVQDEIDALRAEGNKVRELAGPASPPPSARIPNPNDELASKIQKILAHWDDQHGPKRAASHCFAHCDTDHNGRLEWNNQEIKRFVVDVFKHYQLPPPGWPDPFWYGLYRTCDTDQSYSLDLHEAFNFCHYCFDIALKSLLAAGPAQTVVTNHDDGFEQLQRVLAEWETPGALRKVGFECFMHADKNKDGHLEWAGDEIREFARILFQRYGVTPPDWPDSIWYELYQSADCDHHNNLGIDEAFVFARHCIELLVTQVTSGSVPKGDLFDSIDVNHDGTISREEYMAAAARGRVPTMASGGGQRYSTISYEAPVYTEYAVTTNVEEYAVTYN